MTRRGDLPDHERESGSRRKPELLARSLSALVLVIVALGATLFSSGSFLVLVIVASGFIVWEWGRLTRGNGLDAAALISAASVAAIVALASIGLHELALLTAAAAAGALLLTAASPGQAAWSIAGFAYAALPAFSLVWLRDDKGFGAAAVLYLFAVAWTTDTASYGAGRLIGGPKLAPRISPQKTWSGFIVGIATPALVGLAFAQALGSTSALKLAVVSLALALACQIGDLVESRVKRQFGAKDMSQLIPGHGGLLDRVDGLLFAAVLAALIALRDTANPARGLLIW